MGIVISRLSRSARRFNVESRTERVLAREKPEAAPRHPSSLQHIIDPDEQTKEELSKKNIQLDEHLKNVYVTSRDVSIPLKHMHGRPSERDRLPQFRGTVEDTLLGYTELENIPEGKVSLKQVMTILADYKADNEKNGAEAVALKYKVNRKNAENILHYFGSLNVKIFERQEKLAMAKGTQKTIANPVVLEIDDPDKKKGK
ncbi:Uncharacterised protein family (UPF0240) [Nesidiocoris tenuis]|uniref:Protein NDUFAF4 homolog n=1 Tax=Nesidiocoris tenuis TaxID=355587 RepID=A0ABN7AIH2_9HEMI|nr:Uncharacterised protein family (UPF0240) [Nesidiocoris tenuis]